MGAKKKSPRDDLGARARQVLEVVYRLGEASAADIHRQLPEIPSYSAVRSILRALESKGLVKHREKGMRYVYGATQPKRGASRSALRGVLENFFDRSPEHTMQALLEVSRDAGYEIDYDELERLVREARRSGR